MKLCKDCEFFDNFHGKKICKCHVKEKESIDPVFGALRVKTLYNRLDPKEMRNSTAFTFMFWKNCGKSGRYWKAANHEAIFSGGDF